MRGIEAACRQHGFTLLVCNTNNEVNQEQHYLQLLGSYRVEGIVVNAVGMREEALSTLQQSMLPMVLIDRKIPDFACDVVGLNNREAATVATEHLLQQGFEAILFLSEPLGTVNTRLERLHASGTPWRSTLRCWRSRPKRRSTIGKNWNRCWAISAAVIAACARR